MATKQSTPGKVERDPKTGRFIAVKDTKRRKNTAPAATAKKKK
jgi:hypothetical protein